MAPQALTLQGSSENTCTLWTAEGTTLGICGETTEWPLNIPASFISHGRFHNPSYHIYVNPGRWVAEPGISLLMDVGMTMSL